MEGSEFGSLLLDWIKAYRPLLQDRILTYNHSMSTWNQPATSHFCTQKFHTISSAEAELKTVPEEFLTAHLCHLIVLHFACVPYQPLIFTKASQSADTRTPLIVGWFATICSNINIPVEISSHISFSCGITSIIVCETEPSANLYKRMGKPV